MIKNGLWYPDDLHTFKPKDSKPSAREMILIALLIVDILIEIAK